MHHVRTIRMKVISYKLPSETLYSSVDVCRMYFEELLDVHLGILPNWQFLEVI